MRYVRLKDPGTMFHNLETDEDISGPVAKGMKESPRLTTAIRGGALVELQDEEEVNEWNKLKGVKSSAKLQLDADKKAAEEAEAAEKAALEKEKLETDQLIAAIANAENEEELNRLVGDNTHGLVKKAQAARFKELVAAPKGGKK